jgi:tetratricopeptide (TPR) repeat protein
MLSVALKYKQALLAVLLICAAVTAYIPAIKGGFVWDDDAHIVNNANLRSMKGLWQMWRNPRSIQARQVYPLTFTTFWIEYQIWGDNPLGYHLTNVVIHCLNALLLWGILFKLRIPGAWVAACVFALHPVGVESVAWISERKNVLSGLWYFIAFFLFLKFLEKQRSVYYVCSLFSYFLALTAKTMTCSLPVALWIGIWWQKGRLARKDVYLGLPFFLIGIPLGLYTAWLERYHVGAMGAAWDLSFWQRLLIASRAWWFYIGKLLWPARLTFIYPRWEISVGSLSQWGFVLAAVAAVLACWLLRKRIGRGPISGLLFYTVTIFPALGFFNIYPMRYSFVADHFQYLAGLGIIVPTVGIGSYLLSQFQYEKSAVALSVVIMTILTALTWRQGFVYKDKQTLWEDTISKNPTAWMAYNNLGIVYYDQGKVEGAIEAFRRAIELNPGDPDPHNNLGIAYGKKGLLQDAYREIKKARMLKAKGR